MFPGSGAHRRLFLDLLGAVRVGLASVVMLWLVLVTCLTIQHTFLPPRLQHGVLFPTADKCWGRSAPSFWSPMPVLCLFLG